MTTPVFLSFVSIVSLFAVGLLIKKYVKLSFCTMCVSVSLTWIGLLVLNMVGIDIPDVLIALLMGQSVVGLLYLLEKKVPDEYHVFRIPFLLSMTYVAYIIVEGKIDNWISIIFLLVLWIICILLYVVQKKGKLKDMVEHIIACCRDW